jgi:inosine/xanthosine triphosphatase
VSEQPRSDQVTFIGAENRAKNARLQYPEADYWVGIEGGVEELDERLMAFAWVVIVTPNEKVVAKSGSFQLPPRVAELIREGKELGEVDDLVFGVKNSKISLGAIGILTEGKITRAEYYAHAVSLALIPIKNRKLYR